MISAMIIAIRKLIPFLSSAISLPSSFISRGSVTVPIIVNEVIKAATAVIVAPLLSKAAARGNDIIEGICKIVPANAASSVPLNPDFSPIILEIPSGVTKPKSNPIKIMIIRTTGRMRKNDFAAIMSRVILIPQEFSFRVITFPQVKAYRVITFPHFFHSG